MVRVYCRKAYSVAMLAFAIAIQGCAGDSITQIELHNKKSDEDFKVERSQISERYSVELDGKLLGKGPKSLAWPPKNTDARGPLGFGGVGLSTGSRTAETRAVELYYATCRKLEKTSDGSLIYGNARGNSLSFGLTYVSIPPTHKKGEIERPFVWFLAENPSKHFTITRVVQEKTQEFVLAALSARLAGANRHSVLVYVHGHTNTFEDAAFRAAQLKYDLNFPGQVLFFSWPTPNNVVRYLETDTNVEWSAPLLASTLELLAARKEVQEIILLTHSAGADLSAKSIANSKKAARFKGKLRELVLASPDIDRDVFIRDISPALSSMTRRVTIYGNRSDRALRLSSLFRGTERLGNSLISAAPNSKVNKADLIDTSGATRDFLGHTDYAESPSVLKDLALLVDEALPAEARPSLVRLPYPNARVWKVQP